MASGLPDTEYCARRILDHGHPPERHDIEWRGDALAAEFCGTLPLLGTHRIRCCCVAIVQLEDRVELIRAVGKSEGAHPNKEE